MLQQKLVLAGKAARFLWIAGLLVSAALGQQAVRAPQTATPGQIASIESYIHRTWGVLTRSNAQLATAAVDPKFHPGADGKWPVYVSRSEDLPAIERKLNAIMKPADLAKISLHTLPADLHDLSSEGLLYLPFPYVVPGGRFNEMYGWDSYFIQVGLLHDDDTGLAKDLADNFLYEIRQYGHILNANRTYYLTRSQPPFLTPMLLGVYEKTHDKTWLAEALPAVESFYRFWTTEPHLTPETGLSRYYSFGEGPAPEVLSAEKDAAGRNHYELVQQFFRTHQITDYDVGQYYDRKSDRLTPLFFKGDRSMRESGFDPSNRFGAFNIDIIHYNPVCLNSLLYLMEVQTAEILRILDRPDEAKTWTARAADRRQRMNRYLWDPEDGLYYDYNFQAKKTRRYRFATTFFPLWAGVATAKEAAQVEDHLSQFERPGGIVTSNFHSGNQWDEPFGWAPLQMIAVDGLRRYGYNDDAGRVSRKFLSLVLTDFLKRGTIVEKYDVEHPGADVSSQIGFGYRSNEVGFGWTNAVWERLYAELPPGEKTIPVGPAVSGLPNLPPKHP